MIAFVSLCVCLTFPICTALNEFKRRIIHKIHEWTRCTHCLWCWISCANIWPWTTQWSFVHIIHAVGGATQPIHLKLRKIYVHTLHKFSGKKRYTESCIKSTPSNLHLCPPCRIYLLYLRTKLLKRFSCVQFKNNKYFSERALGVGGDAPDVKPPSQMEYIHFIHPRHRAYWMWPKAVKVITLF